MYNIKIILLVIVVWTGLAGKEIVLKALRSPMAAFPAGEKEDGVRTLMLSNGRSVSFGPEIIVKTDEPGVIGLLTSTYAPVKTERLSSSLYLLTFPAERDVLTLSDEIGRTKGVVFAHPNLRSEKELR